MKINRIRILFRGLVLMTALHGLALDGMEEQEGFMKQGRDALIEGHVKAVAYSGFRSGQRPARDGKAAVNPSDEEILEDLVLLDKAGFHLLRVYDVRENTQSVLKVIEENGLPHKVMLGIWLDAEKSNHEGCAWLHEPIPEATLRANRVRNLHEVAVGIELANRYEEIIVAVNVGNETLVEWNDHGVPIENLTRYLLQVKEAIDQPVTTAENYVAWQTYAEELVPVVDFAGIHTYPVWEQKPIEEGLSYTVENMVDVQRALKGVPLAIVEAGWATVAVEFPEQASEENQVRYYDELFNWATSHDVTLFWFEAFDEDWKGHIDNPDGAEKHWGIWDVYRKPKRLAKKILENRTE